MGRGEAGTVSRRHRLWRAAAPLVEPRWLTGWLAALAGLTAIAITVVGVARARLEAPSPTVLLTDRHGAFLGEVGGSDATGYGYWPLADVPKRVAAATVAIEDHRFWHHPGIDPWAVARAIVQDLRAGAAVSGASTLAMQVARMQRPGPRTLIKKASEAVTALCLTARYGRERVLRHYLRLVPYGNQVHGIAHAARRYLDKPVQDLSWAEIAFLAAIPQAPAQMNPFSFAGHRRAVARGRHILALLAADGLLRPAEERAADAELAAIAMPPRPERPACALHPVLALEHELAGSGRQIVHTTIDLELQNEVEWLAFQAVSAWEADGAGNAAVLIVDRPTREVLAWVGSTGYTDGNVAGAIDYCRVPRSPGSALKPFLYAYALEHGVVTPSTILDDLARGAGGIGNADSRFLGPLLPRVALANSRNVPAANLLDEIGLETGYDLFARLGLHHYRQPVSRWGLGLAIGNMPVTLEHLVRAYTVLAGDGTLGDLVLYRGQRLARPERIFSEDTVREITLFLSDPMARLPSFPRVGHLEYPFPVAVKTGTSTNYHDAWTVAWSKRYLVGAWVGHPDFEPMRMGGYRAAALVKEVLLRLEPTSADGLEDVGFPPPRSWRPARLCALSGRLATPACDHVVLEYFPPGQRPVRRCRVHVRAAVDIRDGRLATSATPRTDIEVRTFVDLPPRYAAWQAEAGLPRPPAAPDGPRAAAEMMRLAEAPPHIAITAPTPQLRLLRDPETPAGFSTLGLAAIVDPPAPQVVWYVDGRPFTIAAYPYTARWPLEPGHHSFQVRLPHVDARSGLVRITVD
jgi:penicillin-binding protein 1C